MKKHLYSLLALALLVSCNNKKPNVLSDKTDKTDDEESGWSSKDSKRAVDNCVDFLGTAAPQLTADKARELCSCTVDKLKDKMSYDDFNKVYKKGSEDEVDGADLKSKWKKLDKASSDCGTEIKNKMQNTNDDEQMTDKKKKTKDKDEEQ